MTNPVEPGESHCADPEPIGSGEADILAGDCYDSHTQGIGSRAEFGSETRYYGSPTESERPNSISPDKTKVCRGWESPIRFVKFDRTKGQRLYNIVKSLIEKTGSLYGAVMSNLDVLDEPERSATHSFLVDLYFWEQAVPRVKRTLSTDYILLRSLTEGPSFAKWLDGFKDYVLKVVLERQIVEDELTPKFSMFKATAERIGRDLRVGDLYRPNFLFHWVPPEYNILEVAFDAPQIHDDVLEEFRQEMRSYLNDPRFLFYHPTSWRTMVRDNSTKAIEGPNWKIDDQPPAIRRGVSKVAHISRELKEKRFACVEEYTSSLRIRWINKAVETILSLDRRNKAKVRPGTLVYDLEEAIGARKAKWSKVNPTIRSAYCRDFKKEGLTKPRILLRIMLEELHARFPQEEAFSEPSFFDRWRLVLSNGETIEPLRGHGLGMANNLTTLMQIVIEAIVIKTVGIEPKWSGYVNDDACIIFPDYNTAITYATADRAVCDNLGLAFKKKASFISRGSAVLCEQYASCFARGIGIKHTFHTMEFGNLLKAINVAHAREQAKSCSTAHIGQHLIQMMIEYWGCVLYKGEHNEIPILGGWFHQRSEGILLDFAGKTGQAAIEQNRAAAYSAYRTTQLQPLPWKSRKGRKLKITRHYSRAFCKAKGLTNKLTEQSMFRASTSTCENTRAWNSYLKNLRVQFSRWARQKQVIYINDVYYKYVEDHIEEDVLPPKGEYELSGCRERMTTTDVEFRYPFSSQRMEIEQSIFDKDQKSTEYVVARSCGENLSLGFSTEGHSFDPIGRVRFLRDRYFGRGTYFLRYWNAYLIPNEVSFSYCHNPFHVLKVADVLGSWWSTPIPTRPNQAKLDLIKKRDLYYGYKLTAEEWMLVGSVKPVDQVTLHLCRHLFAETMKQSGLNTPLVETVDILRRYPGIGNFIYHIAENTHTPLEVYRFLKPWMLAHLLKQDEGAKQREHRRLEVVPTNIGGPREDLDDTYVGDRSSYDEPPRFLDPIMPYRADEKYHKRHPPECPLKPWSEFTEPTTEIDPTGKNPVGWASLFVEEKPQIEEKDQPVPEQVIEQVEEHRKMLRNIQAQQQPTSEDVVENNEDTDLWVSNLDESSSEKSEDNYDVDFD